LSPSIAAETQSYLSAQLSEMKNLTDLFSLVHAAKLVEQVNTTSETIENLAALSELLETFRSLDGGYARVPNAKFGSTYATFLTLLAYDELGAVAPEPARVYDFVLSRQRDDGGFVEISAMKRSGANPTCAAIGSLLLLGKQMSAETTTPWRDKAVTFLFGLQADEGGFLANSRIPLADLLSTFTTLWTLHDLHELKQLDSAAIRQFVQGLAVPTGGFRAGVWDERADVEYTFYGLGCSALLASLGA
jgi:geranylgeranyl transferase type-2 subunit beta